MTKRMTLASEVVATTAFCLLSTVAPATVQQEPQDLTTQSRVRVAITAPFECTVDPATKKWVRFQTLVKQWRQERGVSSSITDAAILIPYQGIIGMGEDALPLIIAELKSEGDDPDQWFWALMAITGENPANPGDHGDYRAMAKAWIAWAEDQGYGG